MPSHQKVWCGSLLVWFQDSFWVRNQLVAGQPGQLREGRGVAEGVRQPHPLGLHAELLQEEPLAVDELPGQRLAAGQVAVGLHPHAADRRPLPVLDRLLDPLPDLRVVLLDPGVLLGLGAGEDELRVLVGERGDVGEGAARSCARSRGSATARRESMCAWPTAEMVCALACAGRASTSAQLGARTAAAVPATSCRSSGVQRALQGAQDLVAARVVARPAPASARAAPRCPGRRCQTVLVQDGEVGAARSV